MTPYQFLQDYFSSEENFFIFTLDRNTGKVYQRTFTTQHPELENYLKKCLYFNSVGSDIYYSLNTFKKVDNKLRRRQPNINSIKSFYFDIDTDMKIIYPQIIKFFGLPTYNINTSPNKKQLIYKFDKPYQGNYKYFFIRNIHFCFHFVCVSLPLSVFSSSATLSLAKSADAKTADNIILFFMIGTSFLFD